jgi:alpha-D-ribose 1-methylphosphonate 5-triphosphate synthase subunit PhnI
LPLVQSRGDLIEAIFLVRAYRTTLPRFGYTVPVETAAMQVERRMSRQRTRTLPGAAELLGPTFDYTHRLLRAIGLADGQRAASAGGARGDEDSVDAAV